MNNKPKLGKRSNYDPSGMDRVRGSQYGERSKVRRAPKVELKVATPSERAIKAVVGEAVDAFTDRPLSDTLQRPIYDNSASRDRSNAISLTESSLRRYSDAELTRIYTDLCRPNRPMPTMTPLSSIVLGNIYNLASPMRMCVDFGSGMAGGRRSSEMAVTCYKSSDQSCHVSRLDPVLGRYAYEALTFKLLPLQTEMQGIALGVTIPFTLRCRVGKGLLDPNMSLAPLRVFSQEQAARVSNQLLFNVFDSMTRCTDDAVVGRYIAQGADLMVSTLGSSIISSVSAMLESYTLPSRNPDETPEVLRVNDLLDVLTLVSATNEPRIDLLAFLASGDKRAVMELMTRETVESLRALQVRDYQHEDYVDFTFIGTAELEINFVSTDGMSLHRRLWRSGAEAKYQ